MTAPQFSTCNGRTNLPGTSQVKELIVLFHYQDPTRISEQNEQWVLQNLERGHTP